MSGTSPRLRVDLAYLAEKPIAVVSWVIRDGVRAPGEYAELDPALLRPCFPTGTFWYDGVAESKKYT